MKAQIDDRQNQLMRNAHFELSHNRDVNFKSIYLHSHDFYELYFFVGGKAIYSVENLHYNLECSDIMLISPNRLHQLEVQDLNTTYERIVLWLNPKYVKRLSSKETNLAQCFEKCDDSESFLLRDFHLSEKIRSSLLKIEKLEKSNEFGADIERELEVRKILLSINKYMNNDETDSSAVNARYAKTTNEIVLKTMYYIEENLSKTLSLDEISENVFVSKFYLSRLFKDETNTSIHQYVIMKRLLYSKSLIEKGMSVKELCLKCGFQDESSFFRAFKVEFGMTPKQYGKIMKGE